MAVEVVFSYDEVTRKWGPIVRGASSTKEARQAFNAVALSCKKLEEQLLGCSVVEVVGISRR